MVAGVSAGIARAIGIDPVLVRIAFAAATFAGGVGVFAYVLGWLLIPAAGGAPSLVACSGGAAAWRSRRAPGCSC